MGVLRLSICISGVYATFLLWAIAQERLSKPFSSNHPHAATTSGDKFPSALFLNFAQAIASCLFAAVYLTLGSWRDGTLAAKGLRGVLGLDQLRPPVPLFETNGTGVTKDGETSTGGKRKGITNGSEVTNGNGHADGNGNGNENGHASKSSSTGKLEEDSLGSSTKATANGTSKAPTATPVPWTKTLPALLFQVSLFQTMAGPIGFSALRHISYPTMVLGKSCKLIPVLLLNVVLYRRRFSPHKYLVVALVTVGISMFMFFGPAKKKGGSDSTWGLTLLLVNLLIDGLTNSTQDQIFSTYPRFTGQQMMFMMSSFTILLLLPAMVLPLPHHFMSLVHHLPYPLATRLVPFAPAPTISFAPPTIISTASFVLSHPSALAPILAYALLGGLGQLFIFETIQHFGSLTLVMVTVTRKLFTMLLSVVVFNHTLSAGQWTGVAVVFGGIGVEAGMKRREMLRRAKKD